MLSGDFAGQMDFHGHLKNDWSWCFCNKPPADFDGSANLFCTELMNNSMDTDPARFNSCNSQPFAMNARMRLEHLKSGCRSPSPCCAMNGTLYNYNYQKDMWDSEMKEEESALDLVELLDVGDDVEDEERWLYEFPKKQGSVEKRESALRWCRHVLDNRSPDMEAACRQLINRLDQKSSRHLYKPPAVFHHTVTLSPSPDMDKSSVNITQDSSDSLGNAIENLIISVEITDVHIVARIQEASLRQDCVSPPVASSPRRSPEPSFLLNTAETNAGDLIPEDNTESAPSPPWLQHLLSLSSPSCRASVAEQRCQSPKLSRLQQQITQYKLLKLAQNQASSPGRTRSPVRTSLRSLQAVRNSRTLETDHDLPADQVLHPPSGVLSTRMRSSCWSASTEASVNDSVRMHSVREPSVRIAAIKRPQRSQSLSPCRITQSAKGYLSRYGRVFASPERSTHIAWATQR